MNENEIVNRVAFLEGERKNWDYQAELIERFVMPGKGRFFQEGLDDEQAINWRHRELYDQTAPQLLVLLASNLHSGLMNPGSVWFSPRVAEMPRADKEVREWLESCGNRMHRSLNGSNLSVEANELFQDIVGYGTSIQLHHELDENEKIDSFGGHLFQTPMAREIYFEEDWFGHVIGLYRKRQYTSIQLVDKFGEANLPPNIVQMAASEKANEKHTVVFAVYPRDRENWRSVDVSKYMAPDARPFEGKYVLLESATQLGETYGYHEMPAYAVRWSRTAGSKFGHCPALNTLSDVLSLNQFREQLHQTSEKANDPPLRATQRGVMGDLETFAGGLTITRTENSVGPLVDPRAYRVDVGWKDIAEMKQNLRDAFYVDQLQLKDSPQMTATEVRARMELMQRFLGPVLARIKSDYLDPLVNRTFWMMARKGQFEPPPQVLADNGYDIEYLGPLARAQRMGDVEAIERTIVAGASMAEIEPEVIDSMDLDKAFQHIAEVLGVPAKIMRGEAEVRQRRNDRRQKQRQQEMIAAAPELAAAAKDASVAQANFESTPGVGGVQ